MNLSKKNKLRLLVYPSILLALSGSVLWMKNMPGTSYSDEQPETEKQKILAQKYLNNLNKFANEPRNFTHPEHFKRTAKFIEDELTSYGYKVNILKYGYDRFSNLEVIVEPKNIQEGIKTIVIGAHYDSHEDSPGADDNASSVVILLELAKRFKEKFNSENYKLRIVFFTNEEPPFFKSNEMGSTVYASNLMKEKEKVVGMYAFDMLGNFSDKEGSQHYPFIFQPFFPSKGNFVAFIGNIQSKKFIQNSVGAFRETSKFPSEGVSAPTQIVGIDFSDHSSFYTHNIPALMVTDTAFYRNLNYHKKEDIINNLNLNKMAQLTDALEGMFRKLYEN